MSEGGDGLDRGADDDVFAGGDAGFDAARIVGSVAPGPALPLGDREDNVVHLRAAHGGCFEAEAEADGFEGVDAEDGLRDAAVELAVPVDVAAEPGRDAHGADFDFAADGIAVGLGGVDGGNHRLGGGGVGAADGAGFDGVPVDGAGRVGRADAADGEDAAADFDAELGEEAAGDGADGNAGRGLAGGARSRTLRTSSKPYLRAPGRSAWPGRTRVTRSISVSTGSTAIFSVQLTQSRFWIQRATGEPRVRPWRTPAVISAWSFSIFMRPPRP
ncbi:hypothetical protein O0235_01705 [Tepidiforma flava]|uniref:Uncharacterized protein n=1 Tax=Tepidiforma flava TaxID=3004094 RepID=A0ABY7M720_9CHLR|nr:hypothetical protein [Tepidiforma flava]WBL36321.1 hypothetical protein O0235_01705 [Tepidiforma flava]